MSCHRREAIPEGRGGREDEWQDRRKHSPEQGGHEVQPDRYSLTAVEEDQPPYGVFEVQSKLTGGGKTDPGRYRRDR